MRIPHQSWVNHTSPCTTSINKNRHLKLFKFEFEGNIEIFSPHWCDTYHSELDTTGEKQRAWWESKREWSPYRVLSSPKYKTLGWPLLRRIVLLRCMCPLFSLHRDSSMKSHLSISQSVLTFYSHSIEVLISNSIHAQYKGIFRSHIAFS